MYIGAVSLKFKVEFWYNFYETLAKSYDNTDNMVHHIVTTCFEHSISRCNHGNENFRCMYEYYML